ncbi:MAG: hypothetical protein LBC23_05880 [Coriobacteriales bacterium]|nr:hypothetical protein [Coriobacteriales bacterium]
MIDSVFNTILTPLSEKDKEFLRAMSKDGTISKMSDVAQRMKVSQPYAQKYRRRLIAAGVMNPLSEALSVKKFARPDAEWFDFVLLNRGYRNLVFS